MHLDRAILVMGAGFGDLDNDGWLDVYLGDGEPSYQALLPNRMFRNNGGKSFQDVTTSGGFGHLQKGHGMAVGDIENDGYEDVFEKMGGAFPGDTYQSVLYRNPGNGNHWITLELEGVKTNRAAFGARIRVTLNGGASGKREIYRTVGFGSSFAGNPSAAAHRHWQGNHGGRGGGHLAYEQADAEFSLAASRPYVSSARRRQQGAPGSAEAGADQLAAHVHADGDVALSTLQQAARECLPTATILDVMKRLILFALMCRARCALLSFAKLHQSADLNHAVGGRSIQGRHCRAGAK